MPSVITIQANGQTYSVAPQTKLPEFIRQQGLEPTQVVIERNGEALTPGEAAQAILEPDDRLEIVRIVAGG